MHDISDIFPLGEKHLLILGDCLAEMQRLPDASIDAVVTDPPYGISFQGKAWDGKDIQLRMESKMRKGTVRPDGCRRHDGAAFAAGTYNLTSKGMLAFHMWTTEWAAEAFRVLKPGGYLLSFSSPRTYHRMAAGIEDAGFDIRDQIMWVFGSGYPKSFNVGRKVAGHEGWGTALKPAHEPIVVARKPFAGTIIQNVIRYRTGGINIENCRTQTGRWPSNFIHDGHADILRSFPVTTSGVMKGGTTRRNQRGFTGSMPSLTLSDTFGDRGSAARFFYCGKATANDRDEGLTQLPTKQSPGFPMRSASGPRGGKGSDGSDTDRIVNRKNSHPTVKPTQLMQYLCKLVTPQGGVILDPFMGSGSTGKAALSEGFKFIGIEREEDYFEIAVQRIHTALPHTLEEQPCFAELPLFASGEVAA